MDQELTETVAYAQGRCCVCALTRWQHFSVPNDVMDASLKV